MKHHNTTHHKFWFHHEQITSCRVQMVFLLLKQMMEHEVCRLVSPEHADRLPTVWGKKHKLQNHNDAAKFTTGCWNMVVQQRSFYSGSEAGGLHGAGNVALSKWLEPNVRLSVVSRAQEGREWNSLEGRGWHHSQLLVTPVGTSNDVPGDLERRSHHRKGLKICIFALPWLWAMSELVIITTVCRGMLMWTSNFVELWMDNSQSGLTWE